MPPAVALEAPGERDPERMLQARALDAQQVVKVPNKERQHLLQGIDKLDIIELGKANARSRSYPKPGATLSPSFEPCSTECP